MDFSSIAYEHLLRILECIDDDELYILSLVCRRLNHLAIDVVLRRQGILTYDHKTKTSALYLCLPEHHKALTALRTAFSITSISSLSCEFRPRNSDVTIPLDRDLWRVLDLVVRPIQVPIQVKQIKLWVTYSVIPLLHEEQICDKLFTSTRSRSCQLLEVEYGNGNMRIYTRMPRLKDTTVFNFRCVRPLFDLAGGSCAGGRRYPFFRLASCLYPGHAHTKARRFPDFALRFYTLHNHRQFLPENIQDTLSALKTVDTLHIASAGVWGTVWSDILPRIAAVARDLEALGVDPTGKYLHDLIKFIAALPKIKFLKICVPHHTRWFDDNQVASQIRIPPRLSLLTDISAPLLYIPLLLAGHLPKLRSLEIEFSPYSVFSPKSERTLAQIASRLQQCRHVRVTLNVKVIDIRDILYNLDDFFRSGIGSGSASPYAIASRLIINGIQPFGPRRDQEEFVQVLTQLLRCFTAVHHVTFLISPWREAPAYLVSPLLHSIHTQSPNIKSINVNKKYYDVEKTIAGRERAAVSTGTMCDLDEDVFYLIFQHLETQELYPLAAVSRNLRAWVLPVYLWRRGYRHPTTYLDVSLFKGHTAEQITDISALTLSSIQTTSHLSCTISSLVERFRVFEFLRHLLRLLHKLTAIGKVSIDLSFPQFPIPEHATEAAKAVWTDMILSVLNTIARKSTTLSVRGTGVFSFLTLLQLKGDPFQRLDSPKSTAMSPKHTLSALMIEADIMRLAVFRDWITAVLKDNKTVTCLWLSGVCYVDTYWVPHAINSLPMLTELRIYGSNVLPEEILNAIAQFPLLTHLLLDGCNWKDNQSMKLGVVMGTNPHMPLLRALIAPVEYVAFFLERADALPCLENLTVSIKPSSGPLFVEDTLRSLRYLADRIDRLHRSRSNFPSLSFLARLPMHLGYMTSVGWEVIPQLTTELIFKVMANFNSFDTSAAEYLRRWLPTWVGLQRLRFEFEGDEAQLLESVLADLQFAELCPTLRQVVLSGPNGRTHNLGSSPMGVKD